MRRSVLSHSILFLLFCYLFLVTSSAWHVHALLQPAAPDEISWSVPINADSEDCIHCFQSNASVTEDASNGSFYPASQILAFPSLPFVLTSRSGSANLRAPPVSMPC